MGVYLLIYYIYMGVYLLIYYIYMGVYLLRKSLTYIIIIGHPISVHGQGPVCGSAFFWLNSNATICLTHRFGSG